MSTLPMDPSDPRFKLLNPQLASLIAGNTAPPIQPGFGQRLSGALGGLLGGGEQQSFRGLLGNQDLALALLANSGYGPKRSFGEILGTSALQAKQMGQDRSDADFKREYMKAQMEAMRTPKTANAPSSVQEYEYAKQSGFKGSFQDWIVAGGQSSRPSAVQEWEHYAKLMEDDKKNGTNNAQLYLEMKRTPPWKVETIEQAPTVVQGLPGGKVTTIPLSTTQSEIAASAARKGAEAEAGAVGGGIGQVRADIQKKGSNAEVVFGLLDEADKLLSTATGSGAGSLLDKGAATVGVSTQGAKSTAGLRVIQAGLMMNMPRMEGPQGEKDVELYQQAAAQIGDDKVPTATRRAAMQVIRNLQNKYAERAQRTSPNQQKEDPLGLR